jgi:valyl-tRNA synthetase
VALLGNLEILVPMKGLIDPVAELDRLAKRLRKAEIDMSKLEAKLGNSQFAKNAPPDIVAKDQQRLEELRTEIGQLTAQTARVTQLKNQ